MARLVPRRFPQKPTARPLCHGDLLDRPTWRWNAVWHAPQNPPTRVVVAFHGFGRPCDEMLAYLPLYEEGTAMLSVGSPTKTTAVPSAGWPRPKPCSLTHMAKPWTHGWNSLGRNASRASTLSCSATRWVAASPWRCSKCHPERWMGMTLLAPDGFKKNPMYRFAVETGRPRHVGLGWIATPRHSGTHPRLARAHPSSPPGALRPSPHGRPRHAARWWPTPG